MRVHRIANVVVKLFSFRVDVVFSRLLRQDARTCFPRALFRRGRFVRLLCRELVGRKIPRDGIVGMEFPVNWRGHPGMDPAGRILLAANKAEQAGPLRVIVSGVRRKRGCGASACPVPDRGGTSPGCVDPALEGRPSRTGRGWGRSPASLEPRRGAFLNPGAAWLLRPGRRGRGFPSRPPNAADSPGRKWQ